MWPTWFAPKVGAKRKKQSRLDSAVGVCAARHRDEANAVEFMPQVLPISLREELINRQWLRRDHAHMYLLGRLFSPNWRLVANDQRRAYRRDERRRGLIALRGYCASIRARQAEQLATAARMFA